LRGQQTKIEWVFGKRTRQEDCCGDGVSQFEAKSDETECGADVAGGERQRFFKPGNRLVLPPAVDKRVGGSG
jgi:hypothetical protein